MRCEPMPNGRPTEPSPPSTNNPQECLDCHTPTSMRALRAGPMVARGRSFDGLQHRVTSTFLRLPSTPAATICQDPQDAALRVNRSPILGVGSRYRRRDSTSRDAARRRLEQQAGGPIAAGVGTVAIPPLPPGARGRPLTQGGDEEKLMNLNARNQPKSTLAEIRKGQTAAHVRINIGGATRTASITHEAADELKLTKGMTVHAVIKASDVRVGVD